MPGDILYLESGNIVPADARLMESVNLRVQESALTGESEPVEKQTEPLTATGLTLGDRLDMVYRGTTVTYGRGQAVVTETGMQTELGHIADMIQTAGNEPTPLQKSLDQLAKHLAVIALAIVTVIFVLGMLRGENLHLMFLTAVSMAVAAVPEGLPAVVTITLALGAQRMLGKRALIRKLPAVETLGSVSVICSDKTGTLTENRMTVTELYTSGQRIDFTTLPNDRAKVTEADKSTVILLSGAALCNDARMETVNPAQYIGDPTEGALLVAAARAGLMKSTLDGLFPRTGEIPFDSTRKRMTTVHRMSSRVSAGPQSVGTIIRQMDSSNKQYAAFTKGAVDGLLELSQYVWHIDRAELLTEEWKQRTLAANREMAQTGTRVIAVGMKFLDAPNPDTGEECGLTFIGLAGMIDPPRAEAGTSVKICRNAGIRPIMITGDHPLTALHISRELGISIDDRIMTGQELEHISIADLEKVIDDIQVYARVSPEHKLKIVRALQNRGHNVAMTGDGVNDAPALKKADIGVAMGITGTDVSKEAADMVLLDDNFATIVAAVEEGRTIYNNIRKFIRYLLATNLGEILVMLFGPFLGMPLPLLPLQILWINLVTDGPPALALSVEPAEKDIMRQPPRKPDENILGRGMGFHILWVGLLMSIISLAGGWHFWKDGRAQWQTVVFTILAFSQMANVLANRSERNPFSGLAFFQSVAVERSAADSRTAVRAGLYTVTAENFQHTAADVSGTVYVRGFVFNCLLRRGTGEMDTAENLQSVLGPRRFERLTLCLEGRSYKMTRPSALPSMFRPILMPPDTSSYPNVATVRQTPLLNCANCYARMVWSNMSVSLCHSHS